MDALDRYRKEVFIAPARSLLEDYDYRVGQIAVLRAKLAGRGLVIEADDPANYDQVDMRIPTSFDTETVCMLKLIAGYAREITPLREEISARSRPN